MAECITTEGFMGFFCPEFRSYGCASSGAITFDGPGLVGDTLTIGTLTATAVAGPRVAGSSTWTIGLTAEASATSFAAMLADSLFASLVTGVRSGAVVSLTTIPKGWLSLLSLGVSGGVGDYTLTLFAGGTTMVDTIVSAVCRLVGACFGSNRALAQYYLAAHMLAGTKGLDVGTQVSAAINAISAGFSSTPYGPEDAVFANTPYGRQFLMIRSITPRLGFGVIADSWGGGCGC